MRAVLARLPVLARSRAGAAVLLAALCAAGTLVALGLDSSASAGRLYDQGTPAAKQTAAYHRQFGDEPVEILIQGWRSQGGLPALLLTADLNKILGLEGCLSGNLPRKAKAPAPACSQFARTKPIQSVYGPGTFINESARQVASTFRLQRARAVSEAEKAARAARKIAAAQGRSPAEQEQLAQQARTLSLAQAYQDTLGLALRYGLPRVPQLNDPDFVLKLVFQPSLGFDTPKPRFAYLFPSNHSGLIRARLRPGLNESERRRAIALVRDAVASPAFRLRRGRYLVSGQPVAAEAVAASLTDSLWPLLVGGAAAAALALLLLARRKPRSHAVSVLVAGLVALALTLGAMSLAGASLSLASIAVAPVLIGFACTTGLLRATGGRRGSAATVVVIVASVAGFLAMVASPVPMVRTFGIFTALGIAISLALGARLAARDLPRRVVEHAPGDRAARGGGAAIPILFRRLWQGSLRTAVGRPGRILGVALVLALAGWILSVRTDTVSTLERLAPGGIEAVADERDLQRETGFSGEVAVMVRSDSLTTPPVLRWMSGYQRHVLARHGYSDQRVCDSADLCPALSLTTLIGSARSSRQARRLLDRLPAYFARFVISADRRTASMGFVLHDMSPRDQRRLLDDMRAQLDPPRGVRAELTGTPVLAADTGGQFGLNWLALTAIVLALLFLATFALRVRGRGTLVPLTPAALASGWSALVLYLLPAPLNPMSAALAAIVVALAGAIGIVISARYRERRQEVGDQEALAAAFAGSGTLVAPGLPALAGLGVLVISDVPMLRDFGVAALVDLPLTLLASAVVLPAALVLAERPRPSRLPGSRAEALALARALAGGAGRAAAAAGRRLRTLPAAARRGAAAVRRRLRGLTRRGQAERP
jgi:predicted RND superfamily exporter protein